VLGKVFDSSKVYALQLVKSMLNFKELEPPRRVAFVIKKNAHRKQVDHTNF